jgi:glycosyltransferase involved in cell wall biosynthesis
MSERSAQHPLRITAIIPAFNEEDSIALVLNDIPRQLVDDVVVVDNRSTDRTAEIARQHGATVLHEPQRGYGAACLRGIAHALDGGADILLFLDADYSDHPEEASLLIEKITDDGYDMVIGSRALGNREPGSMTPQALFGNRLATFLMRLIWKAHYTDLGPFRAITADAYRRLDMQDRNWGWTVEMQIKAAKYGLRFTEVPVSYRRRIGTSKISGTISGTIKAGWKILYTIARHVGS